MGLDDHRVAGGERGEEAGVGVPGREGRAADHQRDAAADDFEALLQHRGRVLALRLLPGGLGGHVGHGFPGGGDGFERAVLGMRAAGLERHHRPLARGQHHGVRDLEAARMDARQGFEQHAHAAFGPRGLPGGLGRQRGGDQRGTVAFGIADVERGAEGRALGGDARAFAGLVQRVVLAAERERGVPALGLRALAIDLGRRGFRKGRPMAAVGEGTQGVVEQRAMAVEQGGHG